MYKYLIICNILFISLVKGTTIHPIKTATKALAPQELLMPIKNKTDFVVGEEKTKLSSNLTLQDDNHFVLLSNLENEISSNKTSVVPRKGVSDDDIINTDKKINSKNSTVEDSKKTNNTITVGTVANILQKTNLSSNITTKNDTKIHKPLVVSSEALDKTDKMNNITINTSIERIEVQAAKVNSHPEMIMPIVITILVVPMFAVVGYMALKRGQEAWKNRHYKRMDFLLDGMYND